MSETYRIGPWIFNTALGTLTREVDENRLEDRAARLLELFCHTDGELVTHQQIIDKIWDGRSTSTNSVAVVVADIRRALGDPARQPVYIETVPKRGYRLIVSPERLSSAPAAGSVRASIAKFFPPWGIALMGIAVMLIAAVGFQDRPQPARSALSLASIPVTNETGSDDYAPLQAAISDLIVVELLRHNHIKVNETGDERLKFTGRLIIWSGDPAVSLIATNSAGETVWSGMASGPEDKLPRQIRQHIRSFVEEMDMLD